MDLINKYLYLNENKPLFPGTPEYKKKFDPSYNPYDPEGKVKKALKMKPYGYRDSKPASDEDETPSQQPAMKKRGRPKKMQSEQKNNLPFTPDKPKKPSAVAGKYGAGYSTARHLARMGLRDALKDLKKGPEAGKRQVEEFEFSESHFQVGDKVKFKMSGMKGEVVKSDKEDSGEDGKYYTVKREDGRMKKAAPNDMTKLDEASGASKSQETKFHKQLDKLVHKTFGKRKEEMKEESELDEALRHEIAGAVGQFIGNKIDPVHGDIMRVHGKEAYRQAAYHIRKTVNDVKDAVSSLHDKLHKQLRTGGLTTEEVELSEEMSHSELANYHKEKTRKHGNRAAALFTDNNPDHPDHPHYESHRDAKYAHYDAYEAHKKAAASGNPKDSAAAHAASKKANSIKTSEPTNESVEELKELKRSTLASYTGKAADQMAHAAIDKSSGATMGTMGRMSNMPDLAKKGSDKEDKAFQTILKRTKGITSASRRLAKEEAEQIDEVKVGDKVSFNHPLAAAGGTLVKKTGTVHQIDGDTVHVKVKSKYGVMTHKTKASDLMKEELSSSQRDTHFSLMNKHGVLAKSAKGANKDAHRMAALDHQMALRNPENSQRRSSALSLSNKLGVKEEVNLFKKYTELDEAKFPGFRVRMTSGGPKLPRRSYVPQGDQDPRTGMPLGFSPIKPEPKESDPSKKTKQG